MGKQFVNTDQNGWTWITRNKKSKPIGNPYHKDLENIATSFYVTNMPPALTSKGLWNVCASHGRLVDAFIANKLSKGGKRFGFIKFLGVKDANSINESFKVSVQEIGSWSTKIKDDYNDISSNHDLKEVDHVSESNDEQPIDDFEILQTKLNNMDEQAFDNELGTEGDKKDGENRYSIDSPKKKMEEDTNFNSTNSETKDNSSDLSRPPGFEFMKKSFSSSSNCSTSMARGLSSGLISIWDPNMFSKNSIWYDDSFIIIKGNWKNVVGDYFMVNIYGPQDHVSKLALWNRLTDFMHHHNGSYIMFGDMNAVRNAQERFGTTLNSIEADHFNSFIDSTGLVDLPIGGRSFTWMNKAGTKLSKLDRFLISEDVTIRLPDVRITALDRLWSDHNPILLHIDKTDFGPTPKTVALEEINSIEKRIDEGSAMPSDNVTASSFILKIEKIDKFASMDIIQKAHVKWDIEGDENSKFFHGLINQKRRNQMINGIMVEGNWITNPCLIKDAFLQFYKRKFQAQDSQVMFSNLPHSHSLNCMDRETLERQVTLEEIKEAVWDCGSSKASGPDGYSFAFVKKYWGTIQKDLYDFVNLFFASCVMPNGANSLFFTLIPKVNNPTLITDFRPISLIGIHYKVIDKIVSKEQSAFIAGRQILDGPFWILVNNGALGLKLSNSSRALFLLSWSAYI
ncbi:RNA-directed DNA polymerase, eukaryota, reverse transcriptase zinc-binding domain protein [Tanacetum coccineum]